MKNDNLIELISAINHISLNHEDLLSAVLDFTKIYNRTNPKESVLIDKFFESSEFIEQSVMSAREAIVLAMNVITLDEDIEFSELVKGCVNISSQREKEDFICDDMETKKIMKSFMKELRKELFSRIYSQNKDFYKVSKISKLILQKRYKLFMSEQF